MALSWVRKQVEEKLGFPPYPGTLNIKVKDKAALKRVLTETEKIVISPEKGYCTAKCVKAYVSGIECALILPEIEDYPIAVVEIIAPVNLRETLKLRDGDPVQIQLK